MWYDVTANVLHTKASCDSLYTMVARHGHSPETERLLTPCNGILYWKLVGPLYPGRFLGDTLEGASINIYSSNKLKGDDIIFISSLSCIGIIGSGVMGKSFESV